jgi:hypothetical protein
VTIPTQPSASYQVVFAIEGGLSDFGGSGIVWGVSNKTTTTFDVEFEPPPGLGTDFSVNWILVR